MAAAASASTALVADFLPSAPSSSSPMVPHVTASDDSTARINQMLEFFRRIPRSSASAEFNVDLSGAPRKVEQR
jgi:hypothetical protein